MPFSDATAILIPEIWVPQNQVFRQLSPMQTPRVYHSTGILLSDGRVYEGGGGQCGAGCSENHFNTEILTPPYLLNADGSAATRPVITAASTTVALGGTIAAATSSPVVSFVLMRLSSVTHTTNNDQRRIPLQMQSTNGNSYVLEVPSNPGIVLPGNYWLFALNAQGVPSVAANVLVTLGAPAESFALSPTPDHSDERIQAAERHQHDHPGRRGRVQRGRNSCRLWSPHWSYGLVRNRSNHFIQRYHARGEQFGRRPIRRRWPLLPEPLPA